MSQLCKDAISETFQEDNQTLYCGMIKKMTKVHKVQFAAI